MSLSRVVEFDTSEGLLRVELYDHIAPLVCESFCRLALSGQFDGPLFSYMIPGFVLVGEAAHSTDSGVLGLTELSEGAADVVYSGKALKHVGAGIVSCRLSCGEVACSAFVVTLAPTPKLDNEYVVFGRVYSGMRLLERVSKTEIADDFTLFTPLRVRRCNVVWLPCVHRPLTANDESLGKGKEDNVLVARVAKRSLLDSIL